MSYRCGRVWALLGLWDRIESGEVAISGNDYRAKQARRNREIKYRKTLDKPLRQLSNMERKQLDKGLNGYLVIEDPPCILCARINHATHQLMWIDIRNHGIQTVGEVKQGRQTVDWLAEWIGDVYETCVANQLTALKATAGSQALAAWKHAYNRSNVYVHGHSRVGECEHKGYVGGRCEAYRLGTCAAAHYHLDVRSSYGRICVDTRLPVRLSDFYKRDDFSATDKRDIYASAIATASIETSEPAYPYRRGEDVIYPVGCFTTTLCGPELVDAYDKGRLRGVKNICVYDCEYALRDYAERIYSLRCVAHHRGKRGLEEWCKRLLVSLPGKLNQKYRQWTECPEKWSDLLYGEWYETDANQHTDRYRSISGNIQRDTVNGYAYDTVPAMSAFITSAGRMLLLNYIRCAGWPNVYYVDTDSIFTNDVGYERLQAAGYIQKGELGKLEIRAVNFGVEFRGIKYYIEDGHVTCAGLPKGEVVDVGDGRSYYRRLTPTEQIRLGRAPASEIITGVYQRADVYTHGDVQPDGSVKPITLSEW
jgi:hypothetical protein